MMTKRNKRRKDEITKAWKRNTQREWRRNERNRRQKKMGERKSE